METTVPSAPVTTTERQTRRKYMYIYGVVVRIHTASGA